MKKQMCSLCGKNRAKRTCHSINGRLVCPTCCALVRNIDCLECVHYRTAENYKKSAGPKKEKHFIARIDPDIDEKVDQALAALEKGDEKKCETVLKKLEVDNFDLHIVNFGLGVLYASRKKWDEAIIYFTRAVDIFPYFIEGHFNKAVAHMEKIEVRQMCESLDKVVEYGDPDDELVDHAKELLSAVERNIREDYHISRENYFEAEVIFDSAFEHMRKNEPDRAAPILVKCISINPNKQQSHGNLGLCLAALGRKAEALAELDKAIEIDPTYQLAIDNKSIIEALSEEECLKIDVSPSVDYYREQHDKNQSRRGTK